MKRVISITFLSLFASISCIAQIQQLEERTAIQQLTAKKSKRFKKSTPKGGDEQVVFWAEDFSNGFDGMDENGAWTLGEEQGELWFITYPVGAENGYDPSAALPNASELYGTKIPNYFGERDVCSSPSRDNGVAMIDTDRWNSTSTEENPNGTLTQNPLQASITSPPIDLTGVDYANLTWYNYIHLCCSGTVVDIDFSVDDGANWNSFTYNPVDQENVQMSIEISEYLQGAEDLTHCRIRFNWNGSQSHYFWSLDDVQIEAIPENDLVAGKTWYNSHFDLVDALEADEDPISASEYYAHFEYESTPDYLTNPLNFAMEVTNVGSEIQTGVSLNVEVVSPTGEVYNLQSEPPTDIAAGVTDTLWILNFELDEGLGYAEYGEWTFNYNVGQNEEDENPADNIGPQKKTNISTDVEDTFSYYQNGEETYGGAYINDGENRIFGTAYSFNQEILITHVEAVFVYSEDFAETVVGSTVYFNVRYGSIMEENPDNPETLTGVYFDSDNPLEYSEGDIALIVEEEHLWNSADGGTFVWASFELPTPVLTQPGEIYQAEFRIPASNSEYVFSPAPVSNHEKYASFMYVADDEEWVFLSNNAMPIRFRTSQYGSVDNVENKINQHVSLNQNYPNPFDIYTDIRFELHNTDPVIFELRDISGKLVFSERLGIISAKTENTYRLEKTGLSAGVYTYSIVTPSGVSTKKLTIE